MDDNRSINSHGVQSNLKLPKIQALGKNIDSLYAQKQMQG